MGRKSRSVVLVALASLALACGTSKPVAGTPQEGDGGFRYPAGSVPLGGTCEYTRDCVPLTEPHTAAECICSGPDGVVCTKFSVDVGAVDCDGLLCVDNQSCSHDCPDGGGSCCVNGTEGQACASINCLPELFCNDAKICEKPRAVGETCSLANSKSCLAPAFCDTKTTQCTSPLAEGDTCDYAEKRRQVDQVGGVREPCVDGSRCDSSNICVKPQPNGAACTDDWGCLTFHCVGHRCQAVPCP